MRKDTGGHNRRTRKGRAALSALLCVAAVAAAGDDVDGLLRQADEIKTADNSAFVEIVHGLEAQAGQMTPLQRGWLHYLQAWQLGYRGDYEAAFPALRAAIDETTDATLRFRADASLINDLALAAHYDDAYARLGKLLELQPSVPRKEDRLIGYGVAALLYNQAGQFDLAIAQAEHWMSEDPGDTATCKAGTQKLDSLYRSDRMKADEPFVRTVIDACTRIAEPLFANLVRTFVANVAIAQGRAAEAMKLLESHEAEVRQTRSARVISEFDSIIAKAALAVGDLAQARQHAQRSIDEGIKNEFSKPLVDAYDVLAKVARAQGDYAAALEFQEKHSAADKGYLSDTSAHALAFQMVQQRVLDRKHEVELLSERNQLLQLQQQIIAKTEESQRLYILLLLLVIAFIALWMFRLKRSQMRFQRLARRDGLTGIVNRQHFMDEAKTMLHGAVRSGREVCLILVDLDNFKQVNDTHGHIAGDGVLKQTVEMCQLHMRADDLFGRLGGEEFGVLMSDCSLDTAHSRAEELRKAVAAFAHAGVEITVSASFGVASTRGAGYDLRQLLIQADSALYRAKRNGRNRVESYLDAAAV